MNRGVAGTRRQMPLVGDHGVDVQIPLSQTPQIHAVASLDVPNPNGAAGAGEHDCETAVHAPQNAALCRALDVEPAPLGQILRAADARRAAVVHDQERVAARVERAYRQPELELVFFSDDEALVLQVEDDEAHTGARHGGFQAGDPDSADQLDQLSE